MYKILVLLLALAASAEAIRPSQLSGLKSVMFNLSEGGCKQECDGCMKAFEQIKEMLEDKKYVDDLHRQVDNLCSRMAFMGLDKQCKQVLDKNLDQAIKDIQNNTPTRLCQWIKMCKPDGTELESELLGRAALLEFAQHFGDEICDSCVQAAEQLREMLKDPKAVDDIRKQAAALCSYLKIAGLDDTCRAGVDKYIDQIVGDLNSMEPQQLCQKFQLCPKAKTTKLEPSLSSLAD